MKHGGRYYVIDGQRVHEKELSDTQRKSIKEAAAKARRKGKSGSQAGATGAAESRPPADTTKEA